jgi:hypothetical protein
MTTQTMNISNASQGTQTLDASNASQGTQTLDASNTSQGTQTLPNRPTRARGTQNDADTYLAEFPDVADLVLHLQERVAATEALANAQEGVHLDQVEQLTEQYRRGILELLRRMGFNLPENTTMGEIWANLVNNPDLEHLAPFAMDQLHRLATFYHNFQNDERLHEIAEPGTQTSAEPGTQTSQQVTPTSSPTSSPSGSSMDVDPPPSRRKDWRRFLAGMRQNRARQHGAYSRRREGNHLDPRPGFWDSPYRTQPDRPVRDH